MTLDPVLILVLLLALASIGLLLVLLRRQGAEQHRLRLAVEQALAAQKSDGDSVRLAFQRATADTAERIANLDGALRVALVQMQDQASQRLTAQFESSRAVLEAKLAEIQRGVNEQLHAAVEKQMTDSFARVIDQFTAVQKSMADVQAVTAQIGDLKRLFANVKTRGGWGETQVRAMLDDVLPAGSYLTNHKVRADSDDMVEFAVLMPMRGEHRPVLPIDAKFPVEDYERLLAAAEAGDAEAERQATRALERRIRDEAKKIATKYIAPPATVEFAILYLPTDALYTEVARIPGLIDDIGRHQRVLVLGPSLFPALLHTIHLGFVTLALEQKADEIRALLGATKAEMVKMDGVLDKLMNQLGTVTRTVEQARTRTRAMGRKLRGVEVLDAAEAERLLELESSPLASPDEAEE